MNKHLQRLRQSSEKMPNYREVLDLAEKILAQKGRAKKQMSFLPLALDPIKAKIQMEEGFPYVRPDEIPLDIGETQEYFDTLLGILKEQSPEKYAALKNVFVR